MDFGEEVDGTQDNACLLQGNRGNDEHACHHNWVQLGDDGRVYQDIVVLLPEVEHGRFRALICYRFNDCSLAALLYGHFIPSYP